MIPRARHAALRRRWLAAAAVAVGAGTASGCAQPDAEPAPDGPPRVVASIGPLADLAARVAGPDLRVDVLVPPRADPSTFEPSPRQLRELSDARAFLLVGGGMDDWMIEVPGGLAGVPVVRMNEGIALRAGGHGEGTGDPHTWLDPVLVRERWLPAIVGALAAARPDARARLEARGAELADSLGALDRWMADRLGPARGQALVATHDAWSYLAERYGLVALGAVYESPGREPSARDLADLVDRARAAGVRAVFTEPQLGETGARALAGELDVPVAVLDPLGGAGLEGRSGYLDLMRYNAGQIADALSVRP